LFIDGSANLTVIRGLDPRIHHLLKSFVARWIAGSSPAMTNDKMSSLA
jgi:hypothetical protein